MLNERQSGRKRERGGEEKEEKRSLLKRRGMLEKGEETKAVKAFDRSLWQIREPRGRSGGHETK